VNPSRWRRLALGGAIVGVLGAGVGVVIDRTRTHPVSVADAVDAFRAEDVAAAEAAPELPAPGVYVYATTGGEQLSLPGTRHDYPAETTIIVTHDECGWRERWSPLEERWDDRVLCPGGEPSHYVVHHEFLGQVDERTFVCTEDDTCGDGAVTSERTVTVVGRETLVVGGTEVETEHVRVDEVTTGDSVGPVESHWWRADDGLLVRHTTVVEMTSQTVVGEVDYDEEITLELVALEPRR
jgi:hypothetical protein